MNNEALTQKIQALSPASEIAMGKQYLEVTVPLAEFHNTAKALKENPELGFDYLFCITGVDWDECLSVVYHLESTKHRHNLVIKVKTENRENPVLDTVCDIWKTAEFHEREIFDLLGIKFTNHPDLRRIFLEDYWVGHPLRKDYIDEVNIVER